MKKLFTLLAAATAALTATAQDLIVKTDSTRIEARVAEISPETVRYKRFARPDGPVYVLPVAQVAYIRYADGFMEYYAAKPASEQPAEAADGKPATLPMPEPRPMVPVPQQAAQQQTAADTPTTLPQREPRRIMPVPQQAAQQQAGAAQQQAGADTPTTLPMTEPHYVMPVPQQGARYELGQYYNYNGVSGIIVALNDEHTHGLVVSLDEAMVPWSTFRKGEFCTVGAVSRTSGEENMAAVARYIAEHNGSWEQFPAFKWCRDKGEGWYLPSIDELLVIGHIFNGGSRLRNDRQARTTFNDRLKDNGGSRLNGKAYYISSTEIDEKFPMLSHMGLEPPFVITDVQKYVSFNVRAVHRF